MSFISEFSTLIIFGSILIGIVAIVIESFRARVRKEKRAKAARNRAREKQEMTNTIRQKSKAAEERRKKTAKAARTQQDERLIAFEVKELVDDEAETVRLLFQDK